MKQSLRSLFPPLAVLAMAAAILLASGVRPGRVAAQSPGEGKWRRVEDFLRDHWRYPVSPMGPAPANRTGDERSLLPESCGKCHQDQHRDWRTTFHGKAMGPGVYGQLVDMWERNPEGAHGCNECHAPLAEQQKRLPVGAVPFGRWEKNPAHDHRLEMAGLACASCHVRGWRVHGPPKRQTRPGVNDSTSEGTHGGVERTPFFERAEFCMGCHQHEGSGPHGKPVQNTFREWKESLWGKGGVQCQSCHMPTRKHLWRGIHDQQMTRTAVGLKVALDGKAPEQEVGAVVTVTNKGAGHYFPTYITPSVDVIAELEDEKGNPLAGTRQIEVIERKLTPDFRREIFDTRIPPQESFVMRYRKARPTGAARLRVRVHVKPDHFYLGFFTSFLRRSDLSAKARKFLEEALRNAEGSSFDVFDERIDLRG